MDNNPEQDLSLIQIRAEWIADQSCWIATNILTGEYVAEANTLAEIEKQVFFQANYADESPFHCMPIYGNGIFLLH